MSDYSDAEFAIMLCHVNNHINIAVNTGAITLIRMIRNGNRVEYRVKLPIRNNVTKILTRRFADCDYRQIFIVCEARTKIYFSDVQLNRENVVRLSTILSLRC